LGDGGLLSNIESQRVYTLGVNGSSDYIFQGPGFDNPTNDPVLRLIRGFTYIFDNSSNYSSHPFKIRTGINGTDFTAGVVDNGAGITTFTVPMDAPPELYYQCSVHTSMGNTVHILKEYSSTDDIPEGTSNLYYTDAKVDSHLNTSSAASGQVLSWTGSDYAWAANGSSGSTSVIAPVAFAFVNTTSDGTGTGISWGSWNSSNYTLDFTFDTAQSDTDYSVITDSETFDDYFVGISNKSTTGFRAEFYDNSQSREPSAFSPFTFIVYASTPTIDVSGGGGGGSSYWIEDPGTLYYNTSNVGIGTTDASSELHVVGNVQATYFTGDGSALTNIQSSNVSNFASNVIRIDNLTTDLSSNATRIDNLTTDLSSNATRIDNLTTDLSSNATRIDNLESSDLTIDGVKTFSSNLQVGTANLFVDTESSNVGVGTTTPAYTLDVNGDINFTGTFYQGGSQFVSSLWTSNVDTLYYNTSNVGIGSSYAGYELHVEGNVYATQDVSAFSDARFKENVEPIGCALEKVCSIGGYTYNKIGDPRRNAGVLAQEVMEVLPEVVHGSEDTNYSVSYGNMVSLLIEAIKELKLEIDELKKSK
jgi:hypothetical protein